MMFTVYDNRVHKYSAIHRSTCSRIKVHGGKSKVRPPTGVYHEGLESLEAAEQKASVKGWTVRYCSFCGPLASESV